MKVEQSRPIGTDPDAHRGTVAALNHAWGTGLKANPLLVDQAADADFASLIDRLRGEPGRNNGGQQ